MSDAPEVRQNLQTKQPNVQNFQPANDGWKDNLTDPTDKIRVGLKEGKDSKVEGRDLSSMSRTNVGGMQ